MAINKDNFCVIMGGGIGSRFWPFSRKTLPKQFLDFFGTGRSLLQQTFDRFKKIIPTENIFVVTNALYADLVQQQLPELKAEQILLEPARRNTAPCIAWASYHIRAINPNANIVVAPSDHLILKESEFLTGEDLLPELASKLEPGKDVYGTPEEKKFIDENFPACPNVSIDFGIMEKADNVYVSLGDFGWSDLGTWGSLYDLSPKDEHRNVTLKCNSLLYNSQDNIIALPENKLAVVEGLEGYLIAESDNVLLICKKDEEHAIRKYVNDAQIKMGEDYI